MKGISPIVAAVLLIAITMTIAGVLAYWSASFIGKSLPGANETDVTCKMANFVIGSCSYTNSTKKLNFILDNRRSVDLTDLKLFLYFPNRSVSAPIPLNGSLGANSPAGFSISDITSDFSSIEIRTSCPEATASITCAKS